MDRVRPLLALDEPIAQPDVAERAAHHHLVVAAAGPVRVELERADATLLQPLASGGPRGDRARRRDVVGRDRVAEHRQRAGTLDVGDRRGLEREAVEERRLGDIRRRGVPGVAVARRDRQRTPAIVALEHDRVRPPEQLGVDRRSDDLADLLQRRPDVGEEHRRAVRRAWPSGSLVRSTSTRPASAKATTSGGDAR